MNSLQTVITLLAWLSLAVAAGSFTVEAAIRPRRGPERMILSNSRVQWTGRVSTALALAASLCMTVLPRTAQDHSSTPWTVAAIASAIALATSFLRRWESSLMTIGALLVGAIAPVAAGEALAPRNHDIAGDADLVSAALTTLTAGAWIAVQLLPRADRSDATTRRRMRTLSLFTLVLVTLCDAVALLAQHDESFAAHDLWRIARIVAVAVMALGALPGAALPAAAGGLLAVVAQTMVHATPPSGAGEHLPADVTAFGYSVAQWPTLVNLVTVWRVNFLFLLMAAVAVTLYLLGVRTVTRRGQTWPAGRTAAWITGWVIVVVLTSSGVGRWAPAVFSIHMFLNLGLNMLSVMVLVLGGPVTLALKAVEATDADEPAGLHEWTRATQRSRLLMLAYNPIIALAFMTGTYYVFYLTSIYASSLQSHWLHQLFYLHFFISGYIFYGLVIGVDQPPHPLPHIGKLAMIIGAMPFHAFFGVTLTTKTTVVAQDFLESLGHPWMQARGLMHDQWVGSTIAWAGGEFPLVVVLVALFTQWMRQDKLESQHFDSHVDEGSDESYDAYNQMLAQLAERDRQGS